MENPPMLSARSETAQCSEDFLNKYMNICNANEYDPQKNPSGYINLGTAVNNMSNDIVYPKITSYDVWHCNTDLLQYREGYGISRLKKALAILMTEMLETHKPVKPEDLFCFVGVTACIDVLAHCLGDPGDVFLVPTPVYGRIATDITQRSLVQMWPIPIISHFCTEPYPELTLEKVRAAYKDARANNKNVRALFLVNPSNPLGDIYSSELLMDLLKFCHENQLHVIVDEVYAKSTFPGTVKFRSVLNFPEIPDPMRTHVLYGISKDFAVAGLRVGVIYSRYALLKNCLRQLSFFQTIPYPVMEIAAKFIEDIEWCKNFVSINQQRIRDKFIFCKTRLQKMGLIVRSSVSGFCLWVNFRSVCGSESFAQELDIFRYLIDVAHLYIVPGKELFCAQPGWFRISFAARPNHVMEGFERLEKAIRKYSKTTSTNPSGFACPVCSTTFPSSYHLKLHCDTYKKEFNYKHRCRYCCYGANTKTHVTNHEVTHTKEKSFECKTCHKTFARSETLIRHTKIHQKNTPK